MVDTILFLTIHSQIKFSVMVYTVCGVCMCMCMLGLISSHLSFNPFSRLSHKEVDTHSPTHPTIEQDKNHHYQSPAPQGCDRDRDPDPNCLPGYAAASLLKCNSWTTFPKTCSANCPSPPLISIIVFQTALVVIA